MRMAAMRRQMARDVGRHTSDPDPLQGRVGTTQNSFTDKMEVPVEMTPTANMEDRLCHGH